MIVNYDESSRIVSFEWDSNCPKESQLNYWTEEDFMKVLEEAVVGNNIKNHLNSYDSQKIMFNSAELDLLQTSLILVPQRTKAFLERSHNISFGCLHNKLQSIKENVYETQAKPSTHSPRLHPIP